MPGDTVISREKKTWLGRQQPRMIIMPGSNFGLDSGSTYARTLQGSVVTSQLSDTPGPAATPFAWESCGSILILTGFSFEDSKIENKTQTPP